MFKSFEKIKKILVLEIQNNYVNRAIIGGLEKFLPALILELTNEGVPEELKSAISEFILSYSRLSQADRESSTKIIFNLLQLGPFPVSPAVRKQSNTIPPKIEPVFPKKEVCSHPVIKHPGPPQSKESIGLNASIKALHGIASSRAADFNTLGVRTIRDLLYYFPRRYDDYSTLKPINRIEYGDVLTIIATVQSVLSSKVRNKELTRVEVVVSDGTGFLRLSFFRSSKYVHSFISQFQHGKQLVISGKVEMYLGRKQMSDPSFEELDQNHLNTNGIIPVYPLTSGLSQKMVRNSVNEAMNYYASRISDFLPASIKYKAGLIDLSVALNQIHYPKDYEFLSAAQKRLAFDEIFLLQLGVLQQKRNWVSQSATRFQVSTEIISQIINSFPFMLTNAQQKAIADVQKDLASGSPMNRLLQGDVGSGKTVIAALAVSIIVLNAAQAVIMAPTTILAEQHYRSLTKLLSNENNPDLPLGTKEIQLLTGDTNTKDRDNIKQGLIDGSIKLIIGTHALLEDPIQFNNLQLAVIDEQHRFGVAQRSSLRKKGINPHLLVMTATPIPRSLALTLYGDLELSIMDEMPAGRKPVKTYVLNPLERERAYQIIRTNIECGHQAFIVYPLIEQGDNDEVKAAVDDHKMLQEEIFPELKVGLLHGKMRPDEKESVMKSFRDKVYDILVSTTVIEVGVDIPNATVMMIEGANRFGLAQLHQLRGRVGRGDDQAICLLLPDTEDSIENERLVVMTETNDGFVLAEKDLQQRGPGDFIGYRQSGFADLKMAKITDIRLIEKARSIAQELFNADPMLENPENELLLTKVTEFWSTDSSDIS
ncbi:MAG: ATP-dependent DNA helicase RecG [Chloroflexi bacterium]|nr:MAG: ATP-dependent DNA helicase RecG [Chloroflexota bacterium]MBA4374704.1 DNA helicase RecG [Anaerolinea sp.]